MDQLSFKTRADESSKRHPAGTRNAAAGALQWTKKGRKDRDPFSLFLSNPSLIENPTRVHESAGLPRGPDHMVAGLRLHLCRGSGAGGVPVVAFGCGPFFGSTGIIGTPWPDGFQAIDQFWPLLDAGWGGDRKRSLNPLRRRFHHRLGGVSLGSAQAPSEGTRSSHVAPPQNPAPSSIPCSNWALWRSGPIPFSLRAISTRAAAPLSLTSMGRPRQTSGRP